MGVLSLDFGGVQLVVTLCGSCLLLAGKWMLSCRRHLRSTWRQEG